MAITAAFARTLERMGVMACQPRQTERGSQQAGVLRQPVDQNIGSFMPIFGAPNTSLLCFEEEVFKAIQKRF